VILYLSFPQDGDENVRRVSRELLLVAGFKEDYGNFQRAIKQGNQKACDTLS